MNLVEIAVKRPVTSVMFFILAIMIGVISIFGLQVQLMPTFEFDMLMVSVPVDHESTSDVEKEVASLFYDGLTEIKGIESVSSTSSTSSVYFNIQLTKNANKKDVKDNINKLISSTSGSLPEWAKQPQIVEFDINDFPFYYLVISGSDVLTNKYAIEKEIKPSLEKIDGITKVKVTGLQENFVEITLDKYKLGQYGLTFESVQQSIMSYQETSSLGYVKTENGSISLVSKQKIESIEALENLVIEVKNSRVVLNELADIKVINKSELSKSFFNGEPTINVSLSKTKAGNTSTIAAAVDSTVEQLKAQYPDYEFVVTRNDATMINESVSSVTKAAIIGGVFAVIVLLFFMKNITSTVIIAISIPVSIVISMIFLRLTGTTINVISLGGLSLGVGMLVDNSIVVIENIFRHVAHGKKIRLASIIGVKEVSMAIFASTLTTIVIFVPTLFAKGTVAMLAKDLAITVIATLGTSLFVAVTLVPMIASKWLKPNKVSAKELFFLPKYKSVLKWCLGHRKTVVALLVVILVGSFALVPIIGIELMPQEEQSTFSINASVATGEDKSILGPVHDDINKALESRKDQLGDISYEYYLDSGSLYYTIGFAENVENSDAIISELRQELVDKTPGVTVEVGDSARYGSYYGASVYVPLEGKSFIELQELKSKLEKELVALDSIKGLGAGSGSSNQQTRVVFNKDKMAYYNISENDVRSMLMSYGTKDQLITSLSVKGETIDVHMKQEKAEVRDIESMIIKNADGSHVMFSEIASFDTIELPDSIRREEGTYRTSLYLEPYDYMTGSKDVNAFIANYPFETGYGRVADKEAADTKETMINMAVMFGMAILLVYVVLASQFESFKIPFIIMGTVPMAMIGVIFGHLVFATKIGTLSLMGVVMLSGMIVNSAIVLIDYVSQLRKQGTPIYEAIIEGASTRVRPILMTALTTILAMLPMALNIGESTRMMAPMAVAVVGGMVFGTVLTLFIIPVIYMSWERKGDLKKLKQIQEEATVYENA